jgi:hypothetical protein
MQKIKYIVLLPVLLFFTLTCFSRPTPKSSKNSSKGFRIGIGPGTGFYKINRNHAKGAAPRVGGLVSFKKEFRIGRDYKTFFMAGVDYAFNGLTFKSYYFKPDTLQLYDKKFNYKYSLFFHEINVPLQFKYSFNNENNSLFSGYLMLGYHFRYFLPGTLKVSEGGTQLKSDDLDMKFRTPFIFYRMNSLLSVTIGTQRNNPSASRSNFFIELSYRYGFSPYYFEKDYSASSLFISSSHLVFQLGLKF